MELHKSLQIIDSSKLSDYLQCPRYFFYRHVLGWRPQGAQFDLIFGESMHAALEVLYRYGFGASRSEQQNNAVQALAYEAFLSVYRKWYSEETDDSMGNKNPYSAWDAIQSYCAHYTREFDRYEVLEVNGEKCVEVSGFVPIDSSGSRLYFRQDAILVDKSTGQKFTLEHKTAGRGGITWSAQWDLSLQVGCYTHALYSLFPREEVWGCRVNGLIFLKNDVKFERVPCEKTYPQMQVWHSMIQSWYKSLADDLNWIACNYDKRKTILTAFALNPGSCTKWNRVCAYHNFCTSWPNPLHYADEVPLGYECDYWDPQERKGKEIEKPTSQEAPKDPFAWMDEGF